MSPIDFSKLDDISSRINEFTDQLNESLLKIERKLASLNIGLEAWGKRLSDEGEDHEDGGKVFPQLGFAKIQGHWRLAVCFIRHYYELHSELEEYYPQEEEVYDRQPLLESSRELRIRSIDLIPALVEEINAKATELEETVSVAKRLAEDL